jgi:hypothetical protein
MLDIKYYPRSKRITIDGTTLSLVGWGIFLKVSRQRAHQLYHLGLLEKRVRAKKQMAEDIYKEWRGDKSETPAK